MKQRAHAWVALSALKLLDDLGTAPKLVEMLSFSLSDVWDGAWLPDTRIVDMTYGHIFKMDDSRARLGFNVQDEPWMKVGYDELKKRLKGKRLCLELVRGDPVFDLAYRTHPQSGGHLPNRVIALCQTLGDMLKLCDYPLAFYARNQPPKAFQEDLSQQKVKDLSRSPMFSARQISMMFFVLSHYVTDAHMPLHCDFRDYGAKRSQLNRLPKSLHPSIEKKWEEHLPDISVFTMHGYTLASLDDMVAALPADSMFKVGTGKYKLKSSITSTDSDEWNEMVNVARVSFALARNWMPVGCSYKKADDMLADDEQLFVDVTNRIFHDAILSVARLWLKAWKRFESQKG